MSFYERVIFNRILEWALDRPAVRELRDEILSQARGDILEVGMGTGLNLPSYPASVQRITAVTLEEALDRRVTERARDRGIEVVHAPGRGEELPFAGESFDTVVSTFVLCSVADPAAAVREFRRVLRPRGQLLFAEHVIAQSALGRAMQRVVEPMTRRINCGCSLLRDLAPLIRDMGFQFVSFRDDAVDALPILYRRIIRGVAQPAASQARAG